MHERDVTQCPFHLGSKDSSCPPTCPNHVINSVATRTANLEVEMNIPEYEKEIEGLSEEELASKVKELQLERQVRTLEMVLTNSPLYRNCLRKDGLDFAIIGHD